MRILLVSAAIASLQAVLLLGHATRTSSKEQQRVLEYRDWNYEETKWLDTDDATFDFKFAEPGKIRLAEYTFQFKLSELSALDGDQGQMEQHLGMGFDRSARQVYQEGGHSKPVATLFLDAPLKSSLKRFSMVEGVDDIGTPVQGYLWTDAPEGTSILKVAYNRTWRTENPSKPPCSVGALHLPNKHGCFGSTGTIKVVWNDSSSLLGYEYNWRQDTTNLQTLQGLSKRAITKYWNCKNCPHETFLKYYGYYYNQSDYADQLIQDQFDHEESTNFGRLNSTSVVQGSNTLGVRAEAVATATKALSVWMAVIEQLEIALDTCVHCPSNLCYEEENDRAIRELEKATALYIGGVVEYCMLYQMANEHCKYFKTCGPYFNETFGYHTGTTTSWVNLEILKLMQTASLNLSNGLCDEAYDGVEKIKNYMVIPLLQGLLKNVYVVSFDMPESKYKIPETDYFRLFRTTREKAWGQAKAFTAAMLPLVHHCNKEAAEDLYMHVFQNRPLDVRNTVLSVMDCLNISPELVGGLWNRYTKDYFQGAEPLGSTIVGPPDPGWEIEGAQPLGSIIVGSPDSGPGRAILIVGLTVFAVVVAYTIILVLQKKYMSKQKPDQAKRRDSIESSNTSVSIIE